MIKGYVQNVLIVNLNDGTMKRDTISEKESRQFVGNKGLGAKMLYDMSKPKADPLGPDNPLGFLVGPLPVVAVRWDTR